MPGVTDHANVLIRSPPIAIPRGKLVRIEGWVRVDEPLIQSSDGLIVFDSLGGPQLAHRFRQTDGWERFESFRVSSGEMPVTVSFTLTGLGKVQIDELSVTTLLEDDRISQSRTFGTATSGSTGIIRQTR